MTCGAAWGRLSLQSEDGRVLLNQERGAEPKLQPKAEANPSHSSSHSANTLNSGDNSRPSKGERKQRAAWLRRIAEAFTVCGKGQEQHKTAAAAGAQPGRCPFQA
jgi:hypothetical protein